MHALRLDRVCLQQVVLLLLLLLCGEVFILDCGKERGDVGQDEELRVGGTAGQHVDTLVRQLDAVVLLVDDEIERLDSLWHLAVVVSHILCLDLEEYLLYSLFAEIADERVVLRQRLVDTEQCKTALLEQLLCGEGLLVRVLGVGLVKFRHLGRISALRGGYLVLGFEQEALRQLALCGNNLLHIGLEVVEHLVVTLRHRTGDDERRTGIVDKHRVNLIDYGIVMLVTLHEVFGLCGHVVTQVVEAELVVGAECDVCLICFATSL